MATVYICGEEESPDEQYKIVETEKVKAKLRSLKFSVIIPAEMAFSKMSWSDTLQSRIELLKKSQAIYVLPNWKESIMARIELTVAMDMRLETIFHPVTNSEIKQILTTLDN